MGRRGPLPNPPDIHRLLTGNFRPDHTPKPPPVRPRPPAGMSTPARLEWRRLVDILEPVGLLTRLDRDVLARYCENLVLRAELLKQLEREGVTVEGYRGSVVKHPAWQVFRDITSMLGKDGDRLGLSPAARVRMPIADLDVDDLEPDPFLDLLTEPDPSGLDRWRSLGEKKAYLRRTLDIIE